LLLHLNASIAESYPELGTTWYDISEQLEYVDYLVVAGGGAGGHNGTNNDIAGGGGGAGGLLYNTNYRISSMSSLTVTVGAGGSGVSAGSSTPPTNGNNSVFGSITAIGGGRGAGYTTGAPSYYAAAAGGSGGGGAYANNGPGGATSGQGNIGGYGTSNSNPGAYAGGGGGGAGHVGFDGYGNGGDGGIGLAYDIAGNGSVYYAGGGAGGAGYQIAGKSGGTGGLGGGGNASATTTGTAGTANTGGGAGGSGNVSGPPYPGAGSANGGSGIVVIRYKGKPKATGGTISYSNDYTIHTFTSSGTFSPTVRQNATLVNGPTFSNGAIVLDGSNDWINLPTAGFGGGTLTAEFWVKFNANGNGAYLWCLADSSGGNPELRLNFTSGNQIGYTWFDASAYIISTTSTATLSINTWYHFVTTTTNGQYIFYINGAVDKSLGGSTYDGGTIACHSIGTYNLYGTSPGYGGFLNMSLGVFRFYNRLLSATEVLNNYTIERNRFGV
jgi:hypothetical protein